MIGALATVALGTVFAACGNSAPSASPQPNASSKGILNSENCCAGPLQHNFNPFLPTSAINAVSGTSMIYEPLLQFDALKPAATYPWLATSYHWSKNARSLTFILRHGVTWSDGKPFTSSDVVFTFDLLKKFPSLNANGISFSSIKAEGPYKVVLNFPHAANAQFYYIAGATYMVPRHLWSSVKNPSRYLNLHPVGTGPFVLTKWSTQGLRLARNRHYWQKGEPKIDGINYPSYTSNSSADTALERGQISWDGDFVPKVQTLFSSRSRYNHYWFPAVGAVSILPNLKVPGLNDLAVRKAISLAINRQEISKVGELGYEKPVKDLSGLALPAQASYLAPQLRHANLAPNVRAAKRLLANAGYRMVKGVMTKDGHPLRFTIEEGSGISDYITDAQVIVRDLSAIGIKARLTVKGSSTWSSDYSSGHFDLMILFPTTGPSPYIEYNAWLNDSLSAPVGKVASGDYERWYDPKTQALLTKYQSATTLAAQKAVIKKLEMIVATKLPVIPIVYSVSWAEWSSQQVVGWPSPSNPYEPASPYPPGSEVVALHLRPRS